jgi:hypothetical protein
MNSADGKLVLLAQLGEQAIDYYDDTGECLFCAVDEHKKHNEECSVLEVTRKLKALESEGQ